MVRLVRKHQISADESYRVCLTKKSSILACEKYKNRCLCNIPFKNISVTLNSINNMHNLDMQLLKFRLTRPSNAWLEAIVLDGIHPFPKLELEESIVRSYAMNGPFPHPEGEVDLLLGVTDSLKLLKKKHLFLKNSVYGYVPCGSQSVKTLIDSRNVSTLHSSSLLTSIEALTKAMVKCGKWIDYLWMIHLCHRLKMS